MISSVWTFVNHEGNKGHEKMYRGCYSDNVFISIFPLYLFPYLHRSLGINQFRMLKDFVAENTGLGSRGGVQIDLNAFRMMLAVVQAAFR